MEGNVANNKGRPFSVAGFIDMHTHVLPGLDDGPKDVAESLALARSFHECGLDTVIATPHFLPGTAWAPTKAKVLAAVAALNEELRLNHIALRILPGMEIAYHTKMEERILTNTLLALGNSGHYLVEPSFQGDHYELLLALGSLLKKGVNIILAHPERTEGFQKSPRSLARYVDQGMKIQVNSGSLLGIFGEKCKKTAEVLLQENLFHFIASDAHDTRKRAPISSTDWQQLEAIAQENKLRAICTRSSEDFFNVATSPGH